MVTDPSAIEDMFLAHFHRLFKCDQGQERDASGGFDFPLDSEQPDGGMPNFLNSIKVRLTNQQRSFLDKAFAAEDVQEAVFQMAGFKAPGPDGFVAAFYQRNWDLIGRDVSEAILAFFKSGYLLKEWNHTIVMLIPKVPNLQRVGDFRPISLCNVLYKVISKMMVNRLRSILGTLISKH